jgi:hypothetical protein
MGLLFLVGRQLSQIGAKLPAYVNPPAEPVQTATGGLASAE